MPPSERPVESGTALTHKTRPCIVAERLLAPCINSFGLTACDGETLSPMRWRWRSHLLEEANATATDRQEIRAADQMNTQAAEQIAFNPVNCRIRHDGASMHLRKTVGVETGHQIFESGPDNVSTLAGHDFRVLVGRLEVQDVVDRHQMGGIFQPYRQPFYRRGVTGRNDGGCGGEIWGKPVAALQFCNAAEEPLVVERLQKIVDGRGFKSL